MSGFESGIVYTLMAQGTDAIYGEYHSVSTEQLFLLAHQMGYNFVWREVPANHRISIKFQRKDLLQTELLAEE